MMAKRLTRRKKAIVSGNLHPHYRDVTADLRAFRRLRDRACAIPIPPALEDLAALVDATTSCVVVQNPDFFGAAARSQRARRGLPQGGRAADRGRDRGGVAGRGQAAGRHGRRHRRGRGPVDRQRRSIFGGPYVGPASPRARKFVRQMPGRLVRRDRGCRRAARLRADALDPRAAYPPREGDQQHLHQLRPLRARLHDPPGAAGRGGLHAARRASTTPRRCSSPSAWPSFPASASSTTPSSTSSLCGCRSRRRRVVERLARKRHPRRRAGEPALSPPQGACATCCSSPPPRPRRRTTSRRFAAALQEAVR